MTFHHFNRRVHLYLALVLLPWFLMYGISSLFFNHNRLLEGFYQDGVPLWKTRFDRPYEIEVPPGADLKPIGARIVRENRLEGTYGSYRPKPNQVHVYVYSFLHSVRVTYFTDQKRLVAEDRRFRWDQFFTGMHARGGFGHPHLLDDVWAVVVDLVCLGFLAWIASGILMWWKLPQTRAWGWLALSGGMAVFAGFLAGL